MSFPWWRKAARYRRNHPQKSPRKSLKPRQRPIEVPGRFALLWERLSSFGLAEQAVRLGTHALSLVLVLVVVWAMRSFYLQAQGQGLTAPVQEQALAAQVEAADQAELPDLLP